MPNKKNKFPKEWEPRGIDTKSGWKNSYKFISEIVTELNNEIYIEDESDMMENVDVLLEIFKKRYIITPLKQ